MVKSSLILAACIALAAQAASALSPVQSHKYGDTDGSYATVRVHDDAVYSILGPVCGHGGTHCPQIGDIALVDCKESHKSYIADVDLCILKANATCQAVPMPDAPGRQRHICVLPSTESDALGSANATEVVATTATPAPTSTGAPATVEPTTEATTSVRAEAAGPNTMAFAASGVAGVALVVAVAAAVVAMKKSRGVTESVLAAPVEEDDESKAEDEQAPQDEDVAGEDTEEVAHC